MPVTVEYEVGAVYVVVSMDALCSELWAPIKRVVCVFRAYVPPAWGIARLTRVLQYIPVGIRRSRLDVIRKVPIEHSARDNSGNR